MLIELHSQLFQKQNAVIGEGKPKGPRNSCQLKHGHRWWSSANHAFSALAHIFKMEIAATGGDLKGKQDKDCKVLCT